MTLPAWEGGLALALGALVYDILLAALRRVDHAYPSTDPAESTWWFGYARDAANIVGLLLFAVGFGVLGLPAPLALFAGGLWMMLAYGADYLLARALTVRHPHVVFAALFAALGGVAATLRTPLGVGLTALVRRLF